ncbi:MAG: hypothetical protein IKA36_04215, partial [Clostridia bacterium]|nr:hypothetical protein [Clostridia bacterium]
MQNTWPVSLKKVEELITATKTWCSNTFSLNTHNHDTKYDSKGSASAVQTNLNTHDANTTKHITETERSNWNNKADASHTH